MLRQLVTIEELTLTALARACEQADILAGHRALNDAIAARIARLHQLRTAAAKIVTLATYYKVRTLSTRATYLGAALGFLGVISIVAATARS